ncbi:MAG: autotransporter outer membrane beta-barrel domain-containing protein [Gammaproteobacteria bacterium]|nr:autotransporter outer membrane beta-barrel domain-containing protein [Gammaproteobacteria bacterium]
MSMLWMSASSAAGIDLTFTIGTETKTPEDAVAGALATLCQPLLASASESVPAESQRLYEVCVQLDGGADPSQAYRALSSRSNTAISTLFVQQPSAVPFALIGARLAALQRRSADSMRSSNEFYDFDQLRIPSAWVLAAAEDAATATDAAAKSTLPAAQWSFYLNGEGANYKQDALASVAGFKGHTLGTIFGLDYRWGSNTVVGAASRLAQGAMDIVADGGSLDTTDANVTFYGSWFSDGGAHVDATVGFGAGEFKMKRRIQFVLGTMTVDDTAKGNPNGNQYTVTLGAGYDPYFSNGINASFSGTLRYSASTIDAYNESGSNGLNLHIDSQKLKSTAATVSALLQKAVSFPSFVMLPQASLTYLRHLGGDDATLRARFIADPAQTPFEFKTKTDDPDFATLALGTSAVFPGGSTMFAQYERMLLTQHYSQQSIALGWRREF